MYKFLMYMVFLWAVGTILSLIIAGTWIGSTQTDVMNRMMVMKVSRVGIWDVPVPNSQFFVGDANHNGGLASLINWDFSFLQGSILLWLFYLLNVALAFILLTIFVTAIASIFT